MQGRYVLYLEDPEGEQCSVMIDPHVHLRDWKQSDKETVLHGMGVASRLGFTHLFDMPNTNPPLTSRSTILERLALGGESAEKTGVSYHIWAGITNDESEIEEAVSMHSELFPLIIGLKMFAGHSTGNMGIIGVENQRKVLQTLKRAGYEGVLAVHAEKEELLSPELYIPGRYETHSDARPAIAETESVKDLVSLALETGFEGTLHICHVSAKSTIEYIVSQRQNLKITMGATPHHALLTREDAKNQALMLKMNPPLRSEEDRKAVFDALLDGTIDWAESDHAPHTEEDKEKGASGIPGLPGMDLLLYRLREAGCSEERLKAAFGGNVIRTFGLDAEDIVLPQDPYELYKAESSQYSWNPYSDCN